MTKKVSLDNYVPQPAYAYCEYLLQNNKFDFFLSRPRRTRLGDFTIKPGVTPRITVNINLNPYNFLITYLHEIAHFVVYQKYKGPLRRRVAPHGKEWKKEFNMLLQPVMNEEVFPLEILKPLMNYALNPKASTGADQLLYNSLKKYDDPTASINKTALIHLNEGVDFVFQNRLFVRGSVRRTRVLCTDKVSQRRYTIPAHALVEAC